TLSTTGYGDFSPVTPMAKGFLITVWIFGLGIFGAALVSFASTAFSQHLSRFITPGGKNRMRKNHVILVGNGLIASNTATELARRELPYMQLVASDPEAQAEQDSHVIVGDASDQATLQQAGID